MQRKLLYGLLLCVAPVCLSAQSWASSSYKWKYRPFVVFAASESDVPLAAQRRLLSAHAAAIRERQVVIVWVVGDSVAAQHGPSPDLDAASLRKRFGVALSAFKAVLVGKDGGTIISRSHPLAAGGLFATIDAMPMRREEMRVR